MMIMTSYTVQLIREELDGKTTQIKQYDCETFEEVTEWLNSEMWSYWDCFKVSGWAMDHTTGEVEEIRLK